MMPGELARDAGLSAEEEIVRVIKNVIDRFKQEVKTRFTRLRDLNSKFGFLLNISNFLNGENAYLNVFRQKCKDLEDFYDTDFNGS